MGVPDMHTVSPPKTPRFLTRAFVLAAAIFAATSTVRAQFTYSEDFKNATAAGWVLNPSGNSTPGPVLTSGAAPRSGDPETGSVIDPQHAQRGLL